MSHLFATPASLDRQSRRLLEVTMVGMALFSLATASAAAYSFGVFAAVSTWCMQNPGSPSTGKVKASQLMWAANSFSKPKIPQCG